MVDWFDAFIGLGIGLLSGGSVVAVFVLVRRSGALSQLANARTRAELLDDQLAVHLNEIKHLRAGLADASTQRDQAQGKIALLTQKVDELQQQQAQERMLLDEAKAAFGGAFEALRAEAPDEGRNDLLFLAQRLFKPIEELLETQDTALSKIERRREKLYAQLGAELKSIAEAHGQLASETGRLVTALRRPEVRGRWGEMQLRRVAELAGMIDRCDFSEQQTVEGEERRGRVDMLIHLPNNRTVAVDAKTPLDAFLDALESEDDATRDHCLERHAEQLESKVRELSSKDYTAGLQRSPDFVVLFIPGEGFLYAAVQVRPRLLESAMEKGVVIASPSTLISLLKAVEIGWREEQLAENAAKISELGRELHDRVCVAMRYATTLGKSLDNAVESYHKFVGSIESRVLVSSRKLEDLGAKSTKQLPEELPDVRGVTRLPRDEAQDEVDRPTEV